MPVTQIWAALQANEAVACELTQSSVPHPTTFLRSVAGQWGRRPNCQFIQSKTPVTRNRSLPALSSFYLSAGLPTHTACTLWGSPVPPSASKALNTVSVPVSTPGSPSLQYFHGFRKIPIRLGLDAPCCETMAHVPPSAASRAVPLSPQTWVSFIVSNNIPEKLKPRLRFSPPYVSSGRPQQRSSPLLGNRTTSGPGAGVVFCSHSAFHSRQGISGVIRSRCLPPDIS